MADDDTGDDDLPESVARVVRGVGRRYERSRRAYHTGRGLEGTDLPHDETGRVRIVCRRHAERRAVFLDTAGRPECYDPDHPACEGCVEDIRDGRVETWEPE